MRRHAIGILALALIGGAIACWIWPPQENWEKGVQAACWRMGAMTAVLWLAYPEVKRLPGWIWGVLPVLLAILAVRPKWFLVALPIVIALAVLKPRLPPVRHR